jgi:hypothetical protein
VVKTTKGQLSCRRSSMRRKSAAAIGSTYGATSGELLDKINRSLPAYLHGGDARARRESRFSPLEELEQLSQYVETLPGGTRLPSRVRDSLSERVKQLAETPGFTSVDQQRAARLSERLGGMPS